MKKIFLTQNVNEDVVKQGVAKYQSLCASIGLPFDYEIHSTDKSFTTEQVGGALVVALNGIAVNHNEIWNANTIPCDHVILFYDWDRVGKPRPTNPFTIGNTNITTQIPAQWYGGSNVDVLIEFLAHEDCHFYYQKYGGVDLTHAQYQTGLYQNMQHIDYYLMLLKTFVNKITTLTSKYKYFKDSEVVGLKPELVSLLDKARGIAGVPFKITSGLRTIQQNEDVGGASDSSHLRGYGCDLSVVDSDKRYKILTALLNVGFSRIGVYGGHIHVDCDPNLPKNLIWWKPTN